MIEMILGVTIYFFVVSAFYFKYRKMSLWVVVKSLDMKIKNLAVGYGLYFSMLTIGAAFCFNKLFLIFGLGILLALFALSAIAICLAPLVLGALISRYMLFKDKSIVTYANTLLAVIFMGIVFYLPYLGAFALFSLFAYTLGIVSKYIAHSIF